MNNAVVLKDVLGFKAGDVLKFDAATNDYVYEYERKDQESEWSMYRSVGASIINNNPEFFEVVSEAGVIDNAAWNNALAETPATIEDCIKADETLPVYQEIEESYDLDAQPEPVCAKSFNQIIDKIQEYTNTIDSLYNLNVGGTAEIVAVFRDKISALEWVLYGE